MKLSVVTSFALIAIGTTLHFSPALNYSLFLFVNSLFPNINFWMAITTLGDGAIAGCIFYLLFRARNDVLAKGLIGALIGLGASGGFKKLFAIPRPEHTQGLENSFHLLAHSMTATNYSMPSGHVITAFLVGTFLFQYLRLGIFANVVLALLMAAIAMSRIALGVHWPADVVVGAGLGILIAVVSKQLPIVVTAKWAILLIHFLYLPFLIYAIYKYVLSG